VTVRIAVAMSGGVDSFRTAALLKEQGNDVLALHMRILPESPGNRWSADNVIRDREADVRALASRLNIPLTIIDLREIFDECVITPFIEAYRKGLTPNPCIFCNPRVKFGRLLEQARLMGADKLATGHYARVLPPDAESDRFRLYRASDLSKDQSYFLFALTQEQLGSVAFPLGDVSKKEVLDWARATGVSASLPEESQEICFIPSGDYQEFLRGRMGEHPDTAAAGGPILDMDGNRLGEHKGIFAYTVGQRRGLGIASTAPYYVVGVDAAANAVRVGRAKDLYRQRVLVEGVNWVSIAPPSRPIQAFVRIRNLHEPAPARITPDGAEKVSVRFEKEQRAVTPGQAAVFYDGDVLLGGGIIMAGTTS
jgi:tRNA-specific 2-thiouridylase